MTHKSMEISDILQLDVFVIWVANTKVGSSISRMSVAANDVRILLHKKHFYAPFLVWLIDRRHVRFADVSDKVPCREADVLTPLVEGCV